MIVWLTIDSGTQTKHKVWFSINLFSCHSLWISCWRLQQKLKQKPLPKTISANIAKEYFDECSSGIMWQATYHFSTTKEVFGLNFFVLFSPWWHIQIHLSEIQDSFPSHTDVLARGCLPQEHMHILDHEYNNAYPRSWIHEYLISCRDGKEIFTQLICQLKMETKLVNYTKGMKNQFKAPSLLPAVSMPKITFTRKILSF